MARDLCCAKSQGRAAVPRAGTILITLRFPNNEECAAHDNKGTEVTIL